MSNWKNVNNCHSVNKNCLKWAQAYFDKHLVGISGVKNQNKATVTKVTECTGDVDLNQRKGKIITIYDVELKLQWEGTLADGTEVTGSIHIPEMSHDTDSDDFVFSISINDGSNAKDAIKETIRKELVPQMVKVFEGFSAAMIKENCEDVYIETDKMGVPPPSRVTKEKSGATQFSSNITSTPAVVKEEVKKVNTTTLRDSIEFQTSARELYETLTNAQRVQIWTRGHVIMKQEIKSKFELFGGNVSGEILELIPEQKIVQTWRLRSWPAGHYSKVTMLFKQGSDCVTLDVEQTGVPIGEEDLTRKNWSGYYWRAIKASFGYGANF
ncbi:activator of Hsp90 ATPase [Pilobolus umbonatus]|nr:activator of Hsp90 ATPase [Pilobolus umbonatus]